MTKTIIALALFAPASLWAIEVNPGDTNNQMQYSHTSSSAAASAQSNAVGVGVGTGVGISGGGNASAAGGGGGVGNGGVANSNATGGQGGSSTATAGSSSVTYNAAPAAAQRGTVTIRNTPDLSLSNIAPTAPCMGGTSVGGTGAGFSIGIGTTWKDGDCSLRETARSFAGLGLTQDAVAILCASEYAAAAPSCAAIKRDR